MKKVAALLALALTAFALVACGGDDDDSGDTTAPSGNESTNGAATGGNENAGGGGREAGGSTVKFVADPNGDLAYTTTSASAKAGTVTLDLENPQGLAHDVAIENAQGKQVGATQLVTEGSDATAVDLKPGTYTFYCSVPGHREAGMEGTLTVK
jgi:plastocyanin